MIKRDDFFSNIIVIPESPRKRNYKVFYNSGNSSCSFEGECLEPDEPGALEPLVMRFFSPVRGRGVHAADFSFRNPRRICAAYNRPGCFSALGAREKKPECRGIN